MATTDDTLSVMVEKARDRVRRAFERCGSDARLVGYDVNNIQGYVTANSRPVAMLGASQIIKSFDETQQRDEACLFAGGGRGMFLVPTARVNDLLHALPSEYTERTKTGVIAVAEVPFERGRQQESLHWLKLRLHVAKDEAPPPRDERPRRKSEQCPRCRHYRATLPIKVGDDTETVCPLCAHVTKEGQACAARLGIRGLSLADLSDTGYVAAVSADGNNMGALFDALETLDATAAMSAAVAWIFATAHAHALRVAGVDAKRVVEPVTGGDDIRAFFAPRHVTDYVGALAARIAQEADTLGNLGGALKSKTTIELAKHMGVGVGVVVAGDKTSATWMLQRAHDLERTAKHACANRTWRSAVDFRWITSGDAWIDGASALQKDDGLRGHRPLDLDPVAWRGHLKRVAALAEVPSTQRGIVSERHARGDAEFANLFRYQVARSKHWQRWYEAVGVDWKDAARAVGEAPDTGMLQLLRTMGRR